MTFTFNQKSMVNDLLYAENDLNNPSFIWNGVSYPCTPSSNTTQFQLQDGGFENVTTLSLTVRLYNQDGSPVFADNLIPSPQDTITYNNQDFRVDQLNQNVLGVSFRLITVSVNRGI